MPGRRKLLARVMLSQGCMDGFSGLERDPSEELQCSTGSRAQPQGPPMGLGKAQCMGLGQVNWGSGQRPSGTGQQAELLT